MVSAYLHLQIAMISLAWFENLF